MKKKNIASSGIEPSTFWFVIQEHDPTAMTAVDRSCIIIHYLLR